MSGYDAPTLILIKQVDSLPKKQNLHMEENVSVFGGFTKNMWNDDGKTSGDMKTYIFSLIPRYNIYKIKDTNSKFGPCYFNSNKDNKNPRGLGTFKIIAWFIFFFKGFGYDEDDQNYRIWLDEDINKNSKCKAQDSIFEQGNLLNTGFETLNVKKNNIFNEWN